MNLLAGGGPNIAANTQLGKENNQTLGVSTRYAEQTQTAPAEKIEQVQGQENQVKADVIENLTVQQIPIWVVLLLLLGWLLPTPNTIFKAFKDFILALTKRKQ